jgi:hypothetical protein
MDSHTWQSQLISETGLTPDLTAMAYWCEQRGIHVRLIDEGELVTAIASIPAFDDPTTVTSRPTPTHEEALADLILNLQPSAAGSGAMGTTLLRGILV